MNSYTTDNRWSPGSSGATVPEHAPAAYSARWIDMGDTTPADVVPDRQGFAYDDEADRDALIAILTEAQDLRTPFYVGLIERDKSMVLANPAEWQCWARRAGGYIYVDAWLTPRLDTVDKPDDEAVRFGTDTIVVVTNTDRTWRVVCEDGEVRHGGTFLWLGDAQSFANTGHACTTKHEFVEVWS